MVVVGGGACGAHQAVMAWHAAGVLHLDIKPANVATTSAGDVVVLDAGISRIASRGSAVVRGSVGTPGYIAPELRGDGQHVAVAACDVFSLGTTYRTALDRWVRTSRRHARRMVRAVCFVHSWPRLLARCVTVAGGAVVDVRSPSLAVLG